CPVPPLPSLLLIKETDVLKTGAFVGRVVGSSSEETTEAIKTLFASESKVENKKPPESKVANQKLPKSKDEKKKLPESKDEKKKVPDPLKYQFKPTLQKATPRWPQKGFYRILTDSEETTESDVVEFRESFFQQNLYNPPTTDLEFALQSHNVGSLLDQFYGKLRSKSSRLLYAANIDPLAIDREFKVMTTRTASMADMKCYMKYIRDSSNRKTVKVPGIITPTIYVGTEGTVFVCHREDLALEAVNRHIAGSPKVWFIIPVSYHDQFCILVSRMDLVGTDRLISRDRRAYNTNFNMGGGGDGPLEEALSGGQHADVRRAASAALFLDGLDALLEMADLPPILSPLSPTPPSFRPALPPPPVAATLEDADGGLVAQLTLQLPELPPALNPLRAPNAGDAGDDDVPREARQAVAEERRRRGGHQGGPSAPSRRQRRRRRAAVEQEGAAWATAVTAPAVPIRPEARVRAQQAQPNTAARQQPQPPQRGQAPPALSTAARQQRQPPQRGQGQAPPAPRTAAQQPRTAARPMMAVRPPKASVFSRLGGKKN
ncbi:putative lysine-specific demethylase, partial [Frankliniella fusca]